MRHCGIAVTSAWGKPARGTHSCAPENHSLRALLNTVGVKDKANDDGLKLADLLEIMPKSERIMQRISVLSLNNERTSKSRYEK